MDFNVTISKPHSMRETPTSRLPTSSTPVNANISDTPIQVQLFQWTSRRPFSQNFRLIFAKGFSNFLPRKPTHCGHLTSGAGTPRARLLRHSMAAVIDPTIVSNVSICFYLLNVIYFKKCEVV
ncbi:hypothetical protein [Rhodanobacter sp. MP1X3]|uniref:hypothetical protein n=1 Tax=Rhodanobacter sp. MP1X3 TaxID=2723086 RepID=UPI001608AFC3|nr:hypothetical protein [Rhodanobacter sp. MP1X3]MBB6241524.1 hypothetical protein [Rhodanobacter sp. MP1X3]